MEIIKTYTDRLPKHGFGTNDLRYGIRFLSYDHLITKAIIQHNMRHSLGWLAYDIDTPTAALDIDDRNCPPPNLLIVNPENGHAHALYGLEKAVHNYTGASHKALRYMAVVDLALTDKLGADPGYSKLLSKNATHDRWITMIPRTDLYDLDELASWLDLAQYRDKRRRLPATGLGRNCTLFETLRIWAYRERRKEQQYLNDEMFREACLWRALAINADFTPPLPHSDVRSTVKSVARWTWRNMSRDGFSAWQRRISAMATVTRQAKAEALRESIVKTRRTCPGLTQDDIAALHGCTQQTVSNHLRAVRKQAYKSPISDKGL